jgi:hypothetical protein
MRIPRVLIAAAPIAALLVTSAPAAAASPTAAVKLRACDAGKSAKERRATFYARMRAVPGTSRMMMRFTLIDRHGAGAKELDVRALAEWRRADPGVRSFGYEQRVAKLPAGGVYAVAVEFRWVGASGKTIKTVRRTSQDCRQDGALPNLALTGVKARPGQAPGTQEYAIQVTNDSKVAAREVTVDLFVDGAGADAAELDRVESGETVEVRIDGPACFQRLRAVVDRDDELNETTEADNALVTGCPIPGA